jgi:hypothetical protein
MWDVLGPASERDRMENTALRHVPVGRVLHLHGAPRHFSRSVRAFLDEGFPGRWIGRGDPFPGPHILQI